MGMDDRVADLQTIFRFAEKVFDDKDEANEWMQTPNVELNGDTPQQHIFQDKPDAFEKIKAILQKIERGN